nr:MAG TPA: hypothetical protein [Caudoviricetes sp.]
MWGCFFERYRVNSAKRVFPTHVGVFPHRVRNNEGEERLPHACGGVSKAPGATRQREKSSPRMWGCFSYGMDNVPF